MKNVFRVLVHRWYVIAIAALCLTLISTGLAQTIGSGEAPEWVKTWVPPKVPDDYLSPGELHKVIVRSEDTEQLGVLNEIGSLKVFQYQKRRLYLLSSDVLDGLPPKQRQRLSIRDDQNLIRLRDHFFDTTAPLPQILQGLRLAPQQTHQLHLLQFSGPVQDDWLASLRQNEDIQIVSYFPENAYLVWADRSAREALTEQVKFEPHIQWEGPFHPAYKLHPGFDIEYGSAVQATVQIFTHAEIDESISAIRNKAVNVLKEPRQVGVYTNIVIEVSASELENIVRMDDVVNVEPFIEPSTSGERQGQILAGNLNAAGTGPNGPGYLAWLNSLGFTTNFDFVVDVTDDGFDQGQTTAANVHPVFHDTGGSSRVAYVRRITGTTISTTNDENRGGHGTVDATIVAGFNNAANTDADFIYHADADGYRFGIGIAPYTQVGATKVLDPWTNPDFTTLIDTAYTQGARISNNSWGNVSNPSGTYNAASQEYDALVRDARPASAPSGGDTGNQEMVITFAAGNGGPGASTIGDYGAAAKNTITVGATENFNATGDADGCNPGGCCDDNDADDLRQVIAFSARGPTVDGRTKPDIMAPGTHIFAAASQDVSFDGSSVCGGATNDQALPPDDAYYPADPDATDTRDQDLYTWSSGTSHSAPAVAGGAALLRQWFLNNGHTPPSPAMTKAYLMNTATYMTGPADDLPSDNQGMGQMNLGMVFDDTPRLLFDQVKTAHNTAAVDANEVFTITGQVANNTRPFRVSMAYTDAPGTPGAGTIRNNDLDLEVQVGGNFYRGNDFNQGISNVGAIVDPPDDDNNVESVFLPAGTTGNFTVTVRPTNINSDGVANNGDADDQDFALAIYNAEFPARDPVDIILVLDISGSMDDVAPGGTVPKIDLLKDAVEMFIRTWEPFSIAEDRMGVVYFSSGITATHPPAPASPLLLPFQTNANAFIDNLRVQTANGCTALGGGILTALRGFDALPDRQRHIVVFTNGMQNRSPMVTSVSPTAHQILLDPTASCGDAGIAEEAGVNLADYGVKAIHTIGTGTPGTWTSLVTAVASETGGESQFTSTPDENLEDFFLEDLVAALRVDPVEKIVTVSGNLTNADTGKSEEFEINSSVRKATFAVSWRGDRRPEAVNYLLIAPDGTTVPTSLINMRAGPFYRIASLDFPLDGYSSPRLSAVLPGGTIQHAGTWRLEFQPELTTHSVDYRIHLIVDDADIRYHFDAPTAGVGVGEAIPLSLWAQQGNRTLTGLQDVQAIITRPPMGFGTFMVKNPLSKDQLAKPIDLSGDQFNNLAGKKGFILFRDDDLRKTLTSATETIELFDDGLLEHGDAKADDGVYSALYTNTSRPGFYDVQMSFRFANAAGGSSLRTDSRTLEVGIEQFDLTKSTIDIRSVSDPEGRVAYEVFVTLIDKYDNYLGPGHDILAIVALPGDKWGGRRVVLSDNLDGSYSGRIILSQSEVDAGAGVRLVTGGRSITNVPLPAPQVAEEELAWWFWLLLLLVIMLSVWLLVFALRR